MAQRPLGIVPMSNFTSINGQERNLLQTNERKSKNYLENPFFLEIISF